MYINAQSNELPSSWTMQPAHHLMIEADMPRLPDNGFCRVMLPLWVSGRSYDFSVEVKSLNGTAHPAIIYNVHDDRNFDYLMVKCVLWLSS